MKDYDGYWVDQVRRSVDNSYRGITMAKLATDLLVYDSVIWDSRPEVIVELGTSHGASALWFADQLTSFFGSGEVITVDRLPTTKLDDPRIRKIVASHMDTACIQQVHELVAGRRAMVVEDSAHTYDSTIKALRNYYDLVSPGCYFVVEDTIVEDKEHCPPEWYTPGTVGRAINEFLYDHPEFTKEPHLEHGITMHNGGWLRKG